MRRRVVGLTAAALLIAGAGAPLAAQERGAERDTVERAPLRWSLLAGVGERVSAASPPPLTLGASWRMPRSGFGTRLELAYTGSRSRLETPFVGTFDGEFEPCPGCSSASRDDRLGLLASLAYEFRRDAAVRPYVLSGIGQYRGWSQYRFTNPNVTTPGAADAGPGCVRDGGSRRCSWSSWQTSLHAGAGVAWSLGGVELLGEVRMQQFDGGGRRILPSIGIRF